jgi:hypothetical protein
VERPSFRLSGDLLQRRGLEIAALIGLAAVLQASAAVGLAYVAGFSAVHTVLSRFDWPYVVLTAGLLAASFVGYHFAYRGIYAVDDGPGLNPRQMRAVVAAGFGGFLAHGGSALDRFALEGAGADEREAKVRVAALGGLEHGVLALIGTAAAIAVLALGEPAPPLDVLIPWAVIPIPGFALAFWVAERKGRRARLDRHPRISVFLDSIELIRSMFFTPRRYGSVVLGMALFFVADAAGMWAALCAFGFAMAPASLYVGLATGMVFTRRTGPLGGAGVLMLVLPLTLWYSGAPLATAVAGVFVFRVIGLWLPMPFSLASLSTLRELGNEVQGARGQAEPPSVEPSLQEGAA